MGSGGLSFDPFERTYTAPVSAEHMGFVGSAGLSFIPGEEDSPTSYLFTSSGEFMGFAGGGDYYFLPLTVETKPPPGGYIVSQRRQAFTPNFSYDIVGQGFFGRPGGYADVAFVPREIRRVNYAPLIIAGLV
jgi:hypothetical protein